MSRSIRRVAAAAAVALLAGVLPVIAIGGADAAPVGSGGAFRPLPDFRPTGSQVRVRPTDYRAVRVDLAQVRSMLAQAPRAKANRGVLGFAVPTPRGDTERFAVQRSQVMQSGLAARHPEITTYAGRSLDNPGTTIALDVTPMGFHAAVRGATGQRAWYVDPAYNRRGTTTHLSYYGGEVPKAVEAFAEKQAREVQNAVAKRSAGRSSAPGGLVEQRVYRLALTSDPSYAAYFGTQNVLAEKVTLINRVNQVYNDDLAVTLRLVNATDRLNLSTTAKATGANGPCGEHPCFDAETAFTDSQLAYCDVPGLGRNRTVLGQLVGASNYDIGHLALGLNGGGVAYLGVVGWDYKASGCTGLPTPEGDFFAVDYVAHEMGHQFGGNHTFNGVQYSCSGGNRNGGTSVEPGSGSSVMAYAGICLQDDLQDHSDPYFSQRSIDEISTYTGNALQPVVEVQTVSLRGFGAGGDTVTLGFPGQTPVTLTRGVDYDADGIEAAVEQLTGQQVTIAQWGYDPFGSYVAYPAPIEPVDDSGFQVVFAPDADPEAAGDWTDVASLEVTSATDGVSGFVGETAKGGVADNGGSTVVTTRNHAPRVTAPKNKTIPLRTPFRLKGSGRDSDGDTLTYLWEQNDVGAQDSARRDGGTSLVSNVKRNGPLFRVFGTSSDVGPVDTLESPSPGENTAGRKPERTFPNMGQILAGNTNAEAGRCKPVPPLPGNLSDYVPVKEGVRACFSEFLPVKGYVGQAGSSVPAMHFRLTARDGYPNGGGTAHDDVRLRIDQHAGPFQVTSQAGGRTLRSGSRHKVRWDVNGTRRLAGKVKILLSTDDGKTFAKVLDRRTANDGVAKVRLPKRKVAHARIMVKARGNYFFAVNDSFFRIK